MWSEFKIEQFTSFSKVRRFFFIQMINMYKVLSLTSNVFSNDQKMTFDGIEGYTGIIKQYN